MASSSNDPAPRDEGAQPPKRIRNDRAKRTARQKELALRKRQQEWTTAGVEGKYTKSARLALAVAEKEPQPPTISREELQPMLPCRDGDSSLEGEKPDPKQTVLPWVVRSEKEKMNVEAGKRALCSTADSVDPITEGMSSMGMADLSGTVPTDSLPVKAKTVDENKQKSVKHTKSTRVLAGFTKESLQRLTEGLQKEEKELQEELEYWVEMVKCDEESQRCSEESKWCLNDTLRSLELRQTHLKNAATEKDMMDAAALLEPSRDRGHTLPVW